MSRLKEIRVIKFEPMNETEKESIEISNLEKKDREEKKKEKATIQ